MRIEIIQKFIAAEFPHSICSYTYMYLYILGSCKPQAAVWL